MNRDELIRALRTFIRGALVRDRYCIMSLRTLDDAEDLAAQLAGPMLQELEHPGYYGLGNCPILASHFEQLRKEAEKLFAPHIWSGGVSGGTGYPRQPQHVQTILFKDAVVLRDGDTLRVAVHTAPDPFDILRGAIADANRMDRLMRPRSQHLGYPE